MKVKTILVTQPKPEGDKSPYFDLAKKCNVKIDFRPFIQVEGVSAQDFRKDKINILDFTAVIMTSRSAVDHYFRMCSEMRVTVPETMKKHASRKTRRKHLAEKGKALLPKKVVEFKEICCGV